MPAKRSASKPTRAAGVKATRAYLVQQARSLFRDQGYKDASIGGLIERAGGSKETVYRHFRDKDDLLSAVFEAEIAEFDRTMGTFKLDSSNVKRGLATYAAQVLMLLTSEASIAIRQNMIAEAQNRPEAGKAFFEKYFSKGYEQLERHIQSYQQAGQLRPMNSTHLTEYFGAMTMYRALLMRQCHVSKPLTLPEANALARRVVKDFLIGFGTSA